MDSKRGYRYKTQLCKHWKKKNCYQGSDCPLKGATETEAAMEKSKPASPAKTELAGTTLATATNGLPQDNNIKFALGKEKLFPIKFPTKFSEVLKGQSSKSNTSTGSITYGTHSCANQLNVAVKIEAAAEIEAAPKTEAVAEIEAAPKTEAETEVAMIESQPASPIKTEVAQQTLATTTMSSQIVVAQLSKTATSTGSSTYFPHQPNAASEAATIRSQPGPPTEDELAGQIYAIPIANYWSPTADNIEVVLPNWSSDEPPSREAVDAHINRVLYGPNTGKLHILRLLFQNCT
ncbi:Zf-CCCH domain-containing protein [Quillaja saponaria]|uniref:Zf-CCCH domain-containing protein n=1 Tax=Quillaja saponaria TaxID=32244 RepID=A0AAD7PU93_QUISA|nr:Zf-CCCH domain-containing protein [Quillaja saponaria]